MAVVFGGPGTPTAPDIEKEGILSLIYILLENRDFFQGDKEEITHTSPPPPALYSVLLCLWRKPFLCLCALTFC